MIEFLKDFPFIGAKMNGKPLIYLDTAATTQKPKVVLEEMQNFYASEYATVNRGAYTLSSKATQKVYDVRCIVQKFIHARFPEEVIFTRGTTASLNLLARSLGKAFIQEGDVILVPEIEHHSNIVPWQMMCEERKAILKTIPVNDHGEIDLERFEKLLDERVKVVTLAHISNVIGVIHPISAIIQMARKKGALVCIDAAQSASHIPLDVQEMDADFLVFSGHKTYGPTGVGILYGKKELLDEMPPVDGGGDMIERVSFEKTTYGRLPLKFEAGTPMIAEIIGLGSALKYLIKIGLENICKKEDELTAYALQMFKKIPHLKLLADPKMRGPIISFQMDGLHHLDVASFLDAKGIALRSGHLCSQPAMARFGVEGTLRASFGLYNTFEDVDKLVEALNQVSTLLNSLRARERAHARARSEI